jgi:hypothetical protein
MLGELANLGRIVMDLGRIYSVELLEMAMQAAATLGYRVREDALGGFPGSACQIKGQKWLFVDPALCVRERLQLVLDALAADPNAMSLDLPPPLMNVIRRMRAA